MHHPFPSINQYRNVVKHVRSRAAFAGLDEAGEPTYHPAPVYPKLAFRGTVKLHGTNAAIVFTPEGVQFQSRERVLTEDADNAGFCAHMHEAMSSVLRIKYLVYAALELDPLIPHTVAIFGEWCGGNIQRNVALAQLPKMFVIFGVKVDDEWADLERLNLVYDMAGSIHNIGHFPGWRIEIDFEQPELAQNELARLTDQVEACCPVAKQFNVDGIGEGIVWRCESDQSSDLWFKVKGEKHSASKVKTLAAVDVEAVAQMRDFVAMAVTPARLEQGLQHLVREQLKPFEMTSMGDFIRWVHGDVMKEEGDTLAASGLDSKKLGGPIAVAAKRWFVERLNAETMAAAA